MNKDCAALNNALYQMDLTDIYRAFHPKEVKYTFFSNAHATFSKIDHIIGHKTRVNNFKKTERISSIFSDHEGLKLETNLIGDRSAWHGPKSHSKMPVESKVWHTGPMPTDRFSHGESGLHCT